MDFTDGHGWETNPSVAIREIRGSKTPGRGLAAPLMQSGILDSLAAIALGQFIEERYNLTIDPHEVNADNFGTLNQIATFIRAKQNHAAA